MIFNRLCSRASLITIKPINSQPNKSRENYLNKLSLLVNKCRQSRLPFTTIQKQRMYKHLNSMLYLDQWQDLIRFCKISPLQYLDEGDLRYIESIVKKKINSGKIKIQKFSAVTEVLERLAYDPDERDAAYNELLEEVLNSEQEVKWAVFQNVNLSKLWRFYDREEAESRFSKLLQNAKEQPKNHNMVELLRTYRNGVIHGFWTQKFRGQVFELPNHPLSKGFLDLQKLDQLKHEISKAEGNKQTNTQAKIQQYLEQLSYVYQSSMNICGFQVDFIIGNKVILEYNGYNHYYLNRLRELDQVEKFKQSRLTSMGYVVSHIDYWVWQDLLIKDRQHQHLIEKIENKYVIGQAK